MPKGRTAYSSRAAGPLPARRQWGADGSSAFWDMLGAGPGADGGGIADKECGARVGCKKKPPKGAGAQSSSSTPFPTQRVRCGGVQRTPGMARWQDGHHRALQGVPRPAAPPSRQPRRPTRGPRMRAPKSPPCGDRALLGCAPAAARRPGRPAAILCGSWGGTRRKRSWLPDARSRLSPRGRPDVATVRAGSRARIGLLAAARPPRLRRTARRA